MRVGDFKETKRWSFAKALVWRILAVLNSFIILTLNLTSDPLENALAMNLTGFIIYFVYERLCNKVSWGRENESR